ncbi:MAG: NlpC/P60 family protein [Rubrobacteraceae bacterium]
MLRLISGVAKVFLTGSVVMLVVALIATPEAEAAPYQQLVDNANKKRFKVSTKWNHSSWNNNKHGKNYRVARPQKKGAAHFKVKTPRGGWYTVCGKWPANRKYNGGAQVRVKSAGGMRTKRVNQRKNGGKWNRIGTWKLRKGDSYKIQVMRRSSKRGWIIADAFKIKKATSSKGVRCRKASGSRGGSSGSGTSKGQRIVKAAESYLGKPYKLGGQSLCDAGRYMDCSCLTQKAYRKATNINNLPDDPALQWKRGRKVSNPRPGDILFYKEGTGRITHAGIYAGNNKIVHASNYFGKVVKKPMRWPGDGYTGARRLI